MIRKILFLSVIFAVLSAAAVSAQPSGNRGDFWISAGGDAALFSVSSVSWGGSFALSYGSGASVGIKAAFLVLEEGLDVLELNFLLRFYLQGIRAYSGPYIQLMGGPALINYSGEFDIPSQVGTVSAGLCFGWRFLFANRFFAEPSIRGGYPYLGGAGVSVGVRF